MTGRPERTGRAPRPVNPRTPRPVDPHAPHDNLPEPRPRGVSRLVRIAVVLAIVGSVLVLLFLWAGFRAWSVGVGFFLGIPVLLLAVAVYLVAVVRDLRRREVL